MTFRRIVVVGSSLGGLAPLRAMATALPADFPAPVLIAQHIGSNPSLLPKILAEAGPLPATHARHGEPLRAGHIYVAPPDHHLLAREGRVELSRGPKENHTRPAIDPLFRSAALGYGPAAVGVLLSGALSDGTFGLQAIKACGGVAIVQDPATAEQPDMPESALRYVEVDHCVPVDALGQLLAAIAAEPAPRPKAPPPALAYEHQLAAMRGDPMQNLAEIATPSAFVCPDCRGSLWAVKESDPLRLRCYTGHVYSMQALRTAQGEGLDAALWNAVRALEEKYALLRDLAEAEGNDGALAAEAQQALEAAYRLRELIGAPPGDVP